MVVGILALAAITSPWGLAALAACLAVSVAIKGGISLYLLYKEKSVHSEESKAALNQATAIIQTEQDKEKVHVIKTEKRDNVLTKPFDEAKAQHKDKVETKSLVDIMKNIQLPTIQSEKGGPLFVLKEIVAKTLGILNSNKEPDGSRVNFGDIQTWASGRLQAV
jgi:preprotein translocase subunit SecD